MDSIPSYQIAVGKIIRRYRKEKTWTLETLAGKANLHPNFVGEIERGEKMPSILTIHKLIIALSINGADFFNELDYQINMEDLMILETNRD